MSKKIDILIVDDHEIFRNGLAFVLKTFSNFNVIAKAENGRETLELLKFKKPDIIITDIQMPEMNGVELCEKVSKLYPNIKLLALSMFGEESYLQQILKAGAHGFVLKNIEKTELKKAIELLVQGSSFFSPELLPYFTQKFLKESKDSEITITNREKQILNLIAQGLTNKEIAQKLFISQRTVDGHRANLISKTGSKNIIDMLVYAIKNKLITV